MSSPWVLEEAVRFIGEYAVWFSKAEALAAAAAAALSGAGGAQPAVAAPPLEGALRLLLGALEVQPACRASAQAFRNLCVRCAERLSDGGMLRGEGVWAGWGQCDDRTLSCMRMRCARTHTHTHAHARMTPVLELSHLSPPLLQA